MSALYMATVTPGVEGIAESEIGKTLRGSWNYATYRGRVLFGADAPLSALLSLRCVDNLYAHISSFPVGSEKRDLKQLQQTIASLNISAALAIFEQTAAFRSNNREMGASSNLGAMERPLVVVNASRRGKHSYNRYEAAEAAVSGLEQAHGFRRGDADRHDLSFRLDILDDEALFSLKLTPPSFRFRGDMRAFAPGALRPPLAHALVFLSRPSADDVFLDPFCGSGTIPAERAEYPARRVIASDMSVEAVAAARQNLPQSVEVAFADATRLPYDKGSITTVVTNPPWGKQVGRDTDLQALYARFLKECRRVLAPRGTLVLLTDQLGVVEETAAKAGLNEVDRRRLSLHGATPSLLVYRG